MWGPPDTQRLHHGPPEGHLQGHPDSLLEIMPGWIGTGAVGLSPFTGWVRHEIAAI